MAEPINHRTKSPQITERLHLFANSDIIYAVMTDYKNRICDGLLARKLAGVGAVLLEGPKWCGKTVGPFAYTRKEDGVIVCSISALKP